MSKRAIALLLVLITGVFMTACDGGKSGGNGAGGGTPMEGGTLTVALYSDLDSGLDPHVSSSSAATREILFNVFEGLVKADSQGNLQPAIAESYSVNDTADVYTFTIRQGVKFHNGKDLQVSDVIYSLSRAAGLLTGEPLVADVARIASVEEAEGNKVVVTLKSSDTEFLAHASVAILPEGVDPAAEVVGTGPFRFVSRVIQDNIVLEKNAQYWGEPAHLDKVIMKVMEDPEALVMSLRSGASDIAVRLEASQVSELSDMTILEGSNNLVQALYLNNAAEPFNDIRVRQALCYAVDKQEIIDLAGDGHGTAIGSSMFPAFGKYFMPELTDYYSVDLEKAKALLTDAGYPDGFEFDINVPSNMKVHVDTAQVIVEQLKRIGVTARINQVEWASWLADTYQGRNFQATVIGLDAKGVAASDLLARFTSGSSKNFISFSSPEYDEAYAAATSTTDDAKQTEAFKLCQTILTEQAANVYIQDLASFVAMQKDVAGYEFYPLYVLDLSKLYRIAQ